VSGPTQDGGERPGALQWLASRPGRAALCAFLEKPGITLPPEECPSVIAQMLRENGLPDCFNRWLGDPADFQQGIEMICMRTNAGRGTPRAPMTSPDDQKQEKAMPKTATAKKPPAQKPMRHLREGSKLEIIVNLLRRPQGCTTAEALAATQWPAISFPQQARAAGLNLRKVKEGRITRYFAR
jgi:hypothetical protein